MLLEYGWDNPAIKAALSPTRSQAKDRAWLPVAQVNPEQHAAILVLQVKGWSARDISLAMPVPEAEIVKVLLKTR